MKKILLLVIFSSLNLQAETFNVSTTAEFRVALNNAATNGEDDTIILADGTYKTTDDGGGAFIYFSNLTNTLTLEGSSAEKVIISGDKTHQILNHVSIGDSLLVLRGISFVDGNNLEGDGGAVFTDHSIEIDSCSFINNTAINGGGFRIYKDEGSSTTKILNSHFTNNVASSSGGGFSTRVYYSNNITITDSTFEGNTASIGGAFYESTTYNGNTVISNSTFNDNSASSAGGIYKSVDYSFSIVKMSITNSEFNRNTAIRNGGAIFVRPEARLELSVINSIFSENTAENGGAIYTKQIKSINSLFVNNENSIFISKGDNHEFANSIFYNNLNYDVNANESVIITLKNNYINVDNIEIQNFTYDNVYDNALLEFVNETDNDYRLSSSSSLIDAGTIELSTELPLLDLDGNERISGANIDIGPYEFSTTRPTINSVTYTGTAKEQNELTFTADYTLADGRNITEVLYDFLNDGSYTSINTYTYNAVGTYTIGVKVIDSEGEFSTTSTSVTIAELPFSEMTYEQKLIKAISPEYYDDLLADIALDNANATEAAKQYVQDNLTEFDLVTLADKNTAVSAATSAGITTGKRYVLENPTEFKLMGLTALKSDQNGDGKADILWRNETTGNNWLWSMDGLIIGQSKGIGSVNLEWDIAGRGDFNGDGKSDILWRNRETGLNYIWIMDGITATIRKPLNTVNGAEWQIKSVADFDGDGKADIFWHNQNTGQTYMYLMDGTSISGRGELNAVNSDWQVIGK